MPFVIPRRFKGTVKSGRRTVERIGFAVSGVELVERRVDRTVKPFAAVEVDAALFIDVKRQRAFALIPFRVHDLHARFFRDRAKKFHCVRKRFYFSAAVRRTVMQTVASEYLHIKKFESGNPLSISFQ